MAHETSPHRDLSVPDPEKSRKILRAGIWHDARRQSGRGGYVSDGIINVALLKRRRVRLRRRATTASSISACGSTISTKRTRKLKRAGGTYFAGRPDDNPHAFYEAKYRDPDGVMFDLTHNGWRGAVKEVVPAEDEKVSGRIGAQRRHGSAAGVLDEEPSAVAKLGRERRAPCHLRWRAIRDPRHRPPPRRRQAIGRLIA